MTRRMFWLYRPTAPSVRAQSIQVVHTAHASARRGHQVTLCVQAADGTPTSAEQLLGFYGLRPIPSLRLHVLPVSNTAASVAFRAAFLRWTAGGRGVVIARSKRYAAEALRWVGARFDLVVEAHEVDSAQAAERGEDPSAVRALEAEVLAASAAVICNCEGTAELLRQVHPAVGALAVLHNGAHRSRWRDPTNGGEGVGYAGSLRGFKDPAVLADAAARLGQPVVVVGPDRDEQLERRGEGWLRFEGPVAHAALPDRLARFAVLVVPVGAGLFGERLTSPLKLWDAFAAGRPVVAANTQAIRAAAGDAFAPYAVGDPDDLAMVIRGLLDDPDLGSATALRGKQRRRTWAQRAEEMERFLDGVLG